MVYVIDLRRHNVATGSIRTGWRWSRTLS